MSMQVLVLLQMWREVHGLRLYALEPKEDGGEKAERREEKVEEEVEDGGSGREEKEEKR